MDIDVVPAVSTDKAVLRRLMQFYQYDFSSSENSDVDSHGVFDYRWLDNYWTEESRHPFLIKVDGKWAGFVLVNEHTRIANRPGKAIAEFFVMRKYRRRGIGAHVASEIFRLFPGPWEVAETADNREAQSFWRNVIAKLTGGSFEEIEVDDEHWRGPVQLFESGPSSE